MLCFLAAFGGHRLWLQELWHHSGKARKDHAGKVIGKNSSVAVRESRSPEPPAAPALFLPAQNALLKWQPLPYIEMQSLDLHLSPVFYPPPMLTLNLVPCSPSLLLSHQGIMERVCLCCVESLIGIESSVLVTS